MEDVVAVAAIMVQIVEVIVVRVDAEVVMEVIVIIMDSNAKQDGAQEDAGLVKVNATVKMEFKVDEVRHAQLVVNGRDEVVHGEVNNVKVKYDAVKMRVAQLIAY